MFLILQKMYYVAYWYVNLTQKKRTENEKTLPSVEMTLEVIFVWKLYNIWREAGQKVSTRDLRKCSAIKSAIPKTSYLWSSISHQMPTSLPAYHLHSGRRRPGDNRLRKKMSKINSVVSLVSRLSHAINFAQQLNEATLRAKNQLEIWLSRLPSAPLGHSSYIFRRKNHFRTARFFLRAGWVNTQPRFQEDTYVWGAF